MHQLLRGIALSLFVGALLTAHSGSGHAQACPSTPLSPPTPNAYPMFDWRYLFDGDLPQTIGAALIEDAIEIQVDDGTPFALAANQMRITLVTNLSAKKQLTIWNSFTGYGSLVATPSILEGRIVPPDGFFRLTMTITKSACGQETIVFSKAKFLDTIAAMYHLDPTNFWTLWGGKNITITWIADNVRNPQTSPLCTVGCVIPLGTVVPSNPAAHLVGDFDADGISDIAVLGGLGSGAIAVAFGRWNATFNTTARAVDSPFAALALDPMAKKLVGDFDGDGKSDVALTGIPGSTVPVAFSQGDGTFRVTNALVMDFASFATQPGATPLVGDFDHDGLADIALVGGHGWASVPVAFSNGDGSFRVTNQSAPDFASWAADPTAKKLVGDFNHDGRADIALVGGEGWNTLPVAFGTSSGTFYVTNHPVGMSFAGMATAAGATPLVGDFNRDGRSDIVLTGGGAATTVTVALSDPNDQGTFNVKDVSQPVFSIRSSELWATKLVGDFNGDGTADIALTGVQGWLTVPLLIGNGTGSAFSFSAPSVGTFGVLSAR